MPDCVRDRFAVGRFAEIRSLWLDGGVRSSDAGDGGFVRLGETHQ